jgi:serine protease Do
MPGTQVSLTLWRDGATTDQNLTLAQYPEELVKPAMVKPPSANPDATPDYGLKLSALSPSLRKQYKIAPAVRGVVVTAIDPDGEAADTSLAVGDVIVKAEDQDAQSARVVFTALKAAHEAGKDAGILLIKHDGEFRWLGIHLIDKR